ncbi:expressed unknown protein [Seminavis robusta]|uniref:Uncharacterized protein n=1 Tax=Seminavis robusta TaxID=568900 RepID=A0A9N8DR81_9STRA|nr:expressed unknown protein [Seminavis robusta]|eukprot:Sro293_g110050.1 n/a (296) ;mRNA; f:66190-67077
MQPADFAQQELPLLYKTKSIKRLDPNTYVFHCTTRNDAGGRCNRNMLVVASDTEGGELSLIDPLRITEEGERKLRKLGTVTRIIRLGPTMHAAEEDSYYLNNFPNCQRWAPGEFLNSLDLPVDFKMTESGQTPFPLCKVFIFKETAHPEAALLLYRDGKHGNLLVTGECLQHQLDNEFVNMPVVAKFKLAGLLESDIVVSQQWLKVMMPTATAVAKTKYGGNYKDSRTNRPRMRRMSSLSGSQKAIRGDFMRLLGMNFQRMLSTSGNVVKYGAKKGAVLAVEYAFPLWERSTRGM